MNPESLLLLLLGGGGAGAVGALWRLVIATRKGKVETEGTLLERLNQSEKKQIERADLAERESDQMRRQRDRARDFCSRYWARLVMHDLTEGLPNVDEMYQETS